MAGLDGDFITSPLPEVELKFPKTFCEGQKNVPSFFSSAFDVAVILIKQ